MPKTKKQKTAIAMASLLGVSTVLQPLQLQAQQNEVVTLDENKNTAQKEKAPAISLPDSLQAEAGTSLQEITLPQGWTWAEKDTQVSKDTIAYLARFNVDDSTYDYSEVEGYNAQEHYVERMLTITIKDVKPKQKDTENATVSPIPDTLPTLFAAQQEIAIDETNFPDEAFRAYIASAFDENTDGKLTQAEIANITIISIGGKSEIKDLTGMEHFKALTTLWCYETGITSLDVTNNTALTTLFCYNTKITELDVSKNTELATLWCFKTGIASLDVSKNTKLTTLNCYKTEITELDVSENIALKELTCYETKIKSIDVSNNTALTTLNCHKTAITKLDVSKNTTLTTLNCNNTGVTSLNVRQNTALTYLDCNSTGITSLDVSKNIELTNLYCNYTKLTKLDLSKNLKLSTLWCFTTGITSLDVSKNTALTFLNCSGTEITSLDVSKNTALTFLNCSNTPLAYLNIGQNNKLTVTKKNLKALNVDVISDSFDMTFKFPGVDKSKISSVNNANYDSSTGIMSNYSSENPITYSYDCGISANGTAQSILVTLNIINPVKINETNFPDANFRSYVKANFDTNHDDSLSPQEIAKVKAINVSMKNIVSLQGIEYFTALEDLNCNMNSSLRLLHLESNTNLKKIQCFYTGISNLDVHMLTNLIYLDCSRTNISSLDITNNTALQELYCAGSSEIKVSLETLDVSKNTALRVLNCASTNISSLNIRQNTSLQSLYCDNTNITALDVSENKELTYLSCGNTNISTLNVDNNTNLKQLNCFSTNISKLIVDKNIELNSLDCNDTRISALDVSNNTKLTSLYCGQTNITHLDVSNNHNLQSLSYYGSKINGLDLRNNTALYNVILSSTPFAFLNLPPYNFNDYINLYIENNDLKSVDIEIKANETSFDIEDKFPGIDKNKINNVKGAIYDSQTGMMSNFTLEKPITYTYDCGEIQSSNKVTLSVTLNVSELLAIDKNHFPDDEFRNTYVKTYDKNNDGYLSKEERASVRSINVSPPAAGVDAVSKVTNLTGIEYFTNLEILNCSNNMTTEGGVTILNVSKNTNLVSLNCDFTPITSLNLSKNIKLKSLHCLGSMIEELNVNGAIALTALDASSTKLKTLDLSTNINLEDLKVGYTGITEIDVSKNIKIKQLECNHSGFTSLNVTSLKDLELLYCPSNKLNALDVSQNTKLTTLYCNNNPLAYINIGSNSNLTNFSKTNLQPISLYLSEDTFSITEKFSGIDKSKISNVQNANYDPSTGIMSNYSSENPITYTYDCGYNYRNQTITVTLNIIDYIEINETNFPDAKFHAYVKNNFDADNNGKITFNEISKIKDMDVSNKQISTLAGIEYFTALTELNCYNNDLTTLDISQNTELTILSCSNNQLKSLDTSMNTKLKNLYCNSSPLETIDLTNNLELRDLDLSSNEKLKKLDTSKNTKLTELNASSSGLTNLDLSENTNLSILTCENLGMSSLDVTSLVHLKTLYCDNNNLKTLDVSGNNNLELLYCNYNPLAYLNIGTNMNLTDFAANGLKPIRLESEVNEDSFDITQKIKGIDKSKITMIRGASYNKDTGVMSDYKFGTPVKYTYACGSNGSEQTITVTLNLEKYIEINEKNFPDKNFRTYLKSQSYGTDEKISQDEIAAITEISPNDYQIKSLQGIEYFTALEKLSCSDNPIETLDVSKNTALTELMFSHTQITNLNISKNTNLTILYCTYTPLTTLDVSSNKKLEKLTCSNTNISNLDVSKNLALTDLNCISTKITGLDVRNHTNLKNLNLFSTNLAYLNLDTKSLKSFLYNSSSSIEIQINGDSFKIQDKFSGIDLTKISNVKNAHYDENTGEMSNYQAGTAITYTYHCDTSEIAGSDSNVTINVTLNLTDTREPSTIVFTDENLNKTYDGLAIENPKVTVEGSSGNIRYAWEKKEENDTWTKLDAAPKNAGTYRVIATLEGDENYQGKTSEPKEFKINKLIPQIVIISADQKVYDGKAAYDPVLFIPSEVNGNEHTKWEKREDDGTWTTLASAPINAGVYRYVVTLPESENYTKNSEYETFTITKTDSSITITGKLDKTYDGESVTAFPSYTIEVGGDSGSHPHCFLWEKRVENEWQEISGEPKNAGMYRVTAILYENINYHASRSEPVEFVIKKAAPVFVIPNDLEATYGQKLENITLPANFKWKDATASVGEAGTNTFTLVYEPSDLLNYEIIEDISVQVKVNKSENNWINELNIEDWTYGEKANIPSAYATFGKVTYTYSQSEHDGFTSIVPHNAGTWYVKATIEESKNYKRLEAVKAFMIEKAMPSQIVLPTNLSGVHNALLTSVSLPNEWTWADVNQSLHIHNNYYKARLAVDDTNYDYRNVEGYHAQGHYVERNLNVTISQAINTWIIAPSIQDWTYGEQASAPIGEAANGRDIHFTYSDSETGIFSENVPTNAGTWFLKASVAADEAYTGLNILVKFTIKKAVPSYTLPQNLEASYGQRLADISLPAGFTWKDSTSFVGTAGEHTSMLTYTPQDCENYKTISDIPVRMIVRKAKNMQLESLSLDSWTFGETPTNASVRFQFGTPNFLYSDNINGVYTKTIPTSAGTWFIKAVVDDTENYDGIEAEPISFIIAPKKIDSIKIPEINASTNFDNLVLKDGDKILVQGIDYIVNKVQDGNDMIVTITFKGNYTGSITKAYTMDDKIIENDKKESGILTGYTQPTGLWAIFMTFATGVIAILQGKKQKERKNCNE